MKKISFSFLCDQDPQKMPDAGNNTRHCAQCSRNIVDFTGMSAVQIAAKLKTSAKPCGFMLPWQLDELNEHLRQERSNFIVNRLSRLAKIAAVVSSPLVVQQVSAQNTVAIQNVDQQNNQNNEVLVRAANGTPLCGLELDLINNKGEKIATLKTDALGKIYLNNDMGQGPLTIRHAPSGIEKTVNLNTEAVCLVWQTGLAAQPTIQEVKQDHVYHFAFKLDKGEKVKRMSHTKVNVVFYDSTNQEIRTITTHTNGRGELKLKDADLKGATYVNFEFHTKDGIQSSYSNVRDMDPNKMNELVIYAYERFLMGLMG